MVKEILDSSNNGYSYQVISNPEFLAEGTAMTDLENPDRVLIGGETSDAGQEAVEKVVSIYAQWVPRERIITTNLWSSELSNLLPMLFLPSEFPVSMQFLHCAKQVKQMWMRWPKQLERIAGLGPKFLKSSIGFGGSCFQKDILNLCYLCRHFDLPHVAEYWEQVIRMNEYQKERFVTRLLDSMFNTVSGKRIAILGYAFKKDTNDARESPAIGICGRLLEEKANLAIYDPRVTKASILSTLGWTEEQAEGRIEFCTSAKQACEKSHAIALLTEWDEFKDLDFGKIYSKMHQPAILFDGRNLLDLEELKKIGYRARHWPA